MEELDNLKNTVNCFAVLAFAIGLLSIIADSFETGILAMGFAVSALIVAMLN